MAGNDRCEPNVVNTFQATDSGGARAGEGSGHQVLPLHAARIARGNGAALSAATGSGGVGIGLTDVAAAAAVATDIFR